MKDEKNPTNPVFWSCFVGIFQGKWSVKKKEKRTKPLNTE